MASSTFYITSSGSSLPEGGAAGQYLVKNTTANGDASWRDLSSLDYVKKSGDTMSGDLSIPAHKISAFKYLTPPLSNTTTGDIVYGICYNNGEKYAESGMGTIRGGGGFGLFNSVNYTDTEAENTLGYTRGWYKFNENPYECFPHSLILDSNGKLFHFKSSNGRKIYTVNEHVPMDAYEILDTGNYSSLIDSRYVLKSGDTMTGGITFSCENKKAIEFRPNNTSYHTHISHQTQGNEALVFGTKSTVTSFIFTNGEDPANIASNRWQSITAPGLQIKNNCVSIGYLWGQDVTPDYKLRVNGQSHFTGLLRIYANDQTLTLGAQNSSWIHIMSSSPGFYFNKSISVQGLLRPHTHNTYNLGISDYYWANVYANQYIGNGANISGNLTVRPKTTVPFIIYNNLYFVNKKLTWNYNSYIQHVILLLPVLTSSNYSTMNYLSGKFLMWKIGSNIFDTVEISINVCYNQLQYTLEGSGNYASSYKLCVVTYGGKQYYALDCPYHANPYTNVEFSGWVRSDMTGGTNSQELPFDVAYYNENTATVLNSEVKNSKTSTLTTTYVTNVTNHTLWCSAGYKGAVWNDYAEYRETDNIEPGYVLCETGKDSLEKTTQRLSAFAGVSSDTYGFCQGETEKAKTPIAVSGRVLVYTYQDRNNYAPGDCVCAASGGTVDIMTREEIINFPDRIVGTVSHIPGYEEWGESQDTNRGPVKINGRIWIKVK